MSRKNSGSRTHTITLEGKTIREQFDNYLKGHRKVSDIVGFLSVQNARLLPRDPDSFSPEEQKDIQDFAEYFSREFGAVAGPAIDENWGGETPYLFRLADHFDWLQDMARGKAVYERMSAFRRHETDTLADTLFEIRKDKYITIVTPDEEDECFFSGTIPKKELQRERDYMRYFLSPVIAAQYAGVVVRLADRSKTEVFGIRTTPAGVWVPLSKDEMRDMELRTPSGIMLEPEEGVEYTEIMREKM